VPTVSSPPEAAAPQPPASAEAPAPAGERALPELAHEIGSLRRAVLDHLLDTAEAGPQSVAEILQAMPVGFGLASVYRPGAIRSIKPLSKFLRIADSHVFRLVPAKPSPPPPPSPPKDEALLFAALETWALNPASWNVEEFGPPPDDKNAQISLDVRRRFFDRVRKREQRRKDAEAAAARQRAADAELRDKLLGACHGNYLPGPGLDDVAPIRAVLELVPLDTILSAIRGKTDRKIYPANEPAVSRREPRLLKAIAEKYCKWHLVPGMIETWAKASGKTQAKPAGALETPLAAPRSQQRRETHLCCRRSSLTPLLLMISASSTRRPRNSTGPKSGGHFTIACLSIRLD
jgi:hypothetical protein